MSLHHLHLLLSLLPLTASCSVPFGGVEPKDSATEPLDSEPEDSGSEDSSDDSDSDSGDPAPLCLPLASVTPPWPVEGDDVQVEFSCGNGKDRGLFEPLLHGVPEGADFDPGSWTLRWATEFDDGGPQELLLAVQPREQEAEFPETLLAPFWVADAWDSAENIPVEPKSYTEEWGLPVMHITPSGSIPSEYVPATIWYRGERYEAEIKTRGASSRGYPKVGYNLNFPTPNLDASEDGLGRKDKLALLTTFDDNSYVRQKFCFDLWRDMAGYWELERLTPRSFFIVLYMNGSYHGLYVAVDKVDDQFVEQMGFERAANLYKSVNHDANFYRTDAYGSRKSTLHQGYEKKEGDLADWSDLDALVAFSADSSHADFFAGADTWLDVEEFMDWLLFVHFTSADDSGGKNAYLYNDPAALRFRYAPWDLNHSWGQDWMTLRYGADAYNDFTWNNGIFAHFQAHPEANAILWDRLESMMLDGPFTREHLLQTLEGYFTAIEPSAERDWSRWGSAYRSYGGWASYRNSYGDWEDYQGEKEYILQWASDRVDWMWSYHPGRD